MMTDGPGLSGKGAGDENFPVASWLISAKLRPHVMAFYAFARAGDDIADSADLAPGDKVARLDAMENALLGQAPGCGPETAHVAALRASLAETEVPPIHATTLLRAFRQDALGTRYDNWDDLMGYCALSADPVGRFLLDLHGEPRRFWPASDALCSALQILNHIQDCGADRRDLDRVYLPQNWLASRGLDDTALDAAQASPGLREVLTQMLDGCDALLDHAADLPGQLRSRRLAAESAVIIRLASALSARLRCGDVLQSKITPGRIDKMRAGWTGIRKLVVPTDRQPGSQHNA